MMPLPTYGQIVPLAPLIRGWFPYNIIRTGATTFASTVPWASLQPAGTDYYVSKTGSSGNNGLSPATALDTISNALAKPGPWRIHMVEAGDWDNSKINHPLANISSNMSIVCDAGIANFLGCHLGVTWIASATYPNVYFLADATVCQVLDTTNLDSQGYYKALADVADPMVVSITPNSEFIGTGLDGAGVYVRTFDSRSPIGNDTLHANLSTSEFRFRNGVPNITAYYKNIYWQGVQHVTNRVLSAVSRLTVVMDTCRSSYTLALSANPGGFEFLGTISYLRNCKSLKNLKDGFNYHISAIVPWFYEEDCVGNDNGGDGAGNNNGSTCHDGALGLRLRTTAFRNEGPNIADVGNTGQTTTTQNIACVAGNSVAAANGANYTSGGPLVNMYNILCQSIGSVYDIATSAGSRTVYISPNVAILSGGANAIKAPTIESMAALW